jgi:hypothetical protein
MYAHREYKSQRHHDIGNKVWKNEKKNTPISMISQLTEYKIASAIGYFYILKQNNLQ